MSSDKEAELTKLNAELKKQQDYGSKIGMQTNVVMAFMLILLGCQCYLAYKSFKE